MLDIIRNELLKQEYYICIYQEYIYIFNYLKIERFDSSSIIISFSNFKINCIGTNLLIKKFDKKEILIKGKITSIVYE